MDSRSRQLQIPYVRHELCERPLLTAASYLLDDMAPRLCDHHDTGTGEVHKGARFKKEGPNDRTSIPSSYRADWFLLLAQFDLQQPGIFVPLCCFHSDVEGESVSQVAS